MPFARNPRLRRLLFVIGVARVVVALDQASGPGLETMMRAVVVLRSRWPRADSRLAWRI